MLDTTFNKVLHLMLTPVLTLNVLKAYHFLIEKIATIDYLRLNIIKRPILPLVF